jgi:cytoskeleton protein RodZ
MSNFGEDLRKERVARGVALEDITAVTKISQRHLSALEQGKFRLLPGGILSKGIVRGYAGALGLDTEDWTERFLRACDASGQTSDDERGWTTFASNVGKARLLHREAVEVRLRWIGAVLMLLAVIAGGFLAFRFYGLRQGWWSTLLPTHGISAALHGVWGWTSHLFSRSLGWLRR